MNINDPEVTELENIINIYNKFENNSIKDDLNDLLLINIHKDLFRYLNGTTRFEKGALPGEYVDKQNWIAGGFIPCDFEKKLSELKSFFIFFNEKPTDISDAINRVATINYWFAGIHIFGDGNSRTGRFLLSYYMYKHGFTKKLTFTISRALQNIGGKGTFVEKQAEVWNKRDLNLYKEWFINELLLISWPASLKRIINN